MQVVAILLKRVEERPVGFRLELLDASTVEGDLKTITKNLRDPDRKISWIRGCVSDPAQIPGASISVLVKKVDEFDARGEWVTIDFPLHDTPKSVRTKLDMVCAESYRRSGAICRPVKIRISA